MHAPGHNGAARPRLLIADEPTTALDVTVQKQILDLLARLRRDLGLALLFITHDLGVVAQVADRIAVTYAGRIVEEGPAREVLERPRHPYTAGLLRASPQLVRQKLEPIPGTVPSLTALPPGCAFEPRCPLRVPECTAAMPELRAAGPEHRARCILVGRREIDCSDASWRIGFSLFTDNSRGLSRARVRLAIGVDSKLGNARVSARTLAVQNGAADLFSALRVLLTVGDEKANDH